MKWVGHVAAAISVLVLLSMSAAVGLVYMHYPRDEAGFIRYLDRYGDGSPRTHQLPPREDLIAAGNRACGWLGEQPMALWRRSERFRVVNVDERWLSSPASRELAWDGQPRPGWIRAAAWHYLCPATFELVEPHTFWFLGRYRSD